MGIYTLSFSGGICWMMTILKTNTDLNTHGESRSENDLYMVKIQAYSTLQEGSWKGWVLHGHIIAILSQFSRTVSGLL